MIALASVLGGVLWWCMNGFLAGDTLVYWLAGHRLNVGHSLYDLVSTDTWLFSRPEFPLFSPPFIAVPWMVLASLPGRLGLEIWWIGMAMCALWAVAVAILGTRGWAALLVLPLVPSIVLLVGVGNVDALVLAGVVAFYLLLRDGHDRAAGAVVAILVSIKLTPATLVVWLLITRRWRSLALFAIVASMLAILTATTLGSGIFFRYLRVMAAGATSGNQLAVGLLILGFIGMWFLRKYPTWSFILGVVLIPVGSPQAAGHSWAMLVAATAPFCRRLHTSFVGSHLESAKS